MPAHSLIENAPPWPGGARCAASVSFDVDVDSMLRLVHGAGAAARVAAMSWLSYDVVAVPRLLHIFAARQLRQTFFFPGWCLDRHGHLAEQVAAAGHEIGLHGYLHEVSYEQSQAEEEESLLRGLESYERVVGGRPAGWRAPLYGMSDRTVELLVREGFSYDASLMGDDVPYVLRDRLGDLVELPSEWANDDWVHYAHSPDLDYLAQIRSPRQAAEVFTAEFEAARAHGGLWISVWHPNVSGRLARVAEVAALLDRMIEHQDVWIAPLGEIADHVNQCIADGSFRPRIVPVERVSAPANP